MSRLIDAYELSKVKFHPLPYTHIVPNGENAESYEHGWNDAIDAIISDAPTVDAVPVVHGHWIDKPTGRYGQWQSWCSVCGKHSGIGGNESNRHKPFCPNCGSRMNLEMCEIMHEVTE